MSSRKLEIAAKFVRESIASDSVHDPLAAIRFAERVSANRRRRARRAQLFVPTALLLCVLGGGFAVHALRAPKVTYRIGDSTETGLLGSYLSAPQASSLPLRFSEGSVVALAPRARGRVAQTSRHGATVVIEDGRAHVAVVHRSDTAFRILAGPFAVNVTGTEFDVSFDVATQTFSLKMNSGEVRITGPGLPSPVDVRNHEELRLSAKTPGIVASSAAIDAIAQNAKPENSAALPKETQPQVDMGKLSRLEVPSRTQPSAVQVPNIAELEATGQHHRIVELAEKQGLESAVNRWDAFALMALGNSARYLGRAALAAQSYRATRARFAHSREAIASAFYLGRLLEGSAKDQAIAWFERYASEAPNGEYVADALGRRVVLLQELEPGSKAETAAAQYLKRFPSGPYSGFARKLLAP